MKILVVKSVAIITAAFKAADVEFLQSIAPQALELKDEDGNVIFAASVSEKPTLSNFGIAVAEKRDIVLQFDKPITREKVMEMYPGAFVRLPMLETQIALAVEHYRGQLGEIQYEVLEEQAVPQED